MDYDYTIADVAYFNPNIRGFLGDDDEQHIGGIFGGTWCQDTINEETGDYFEPGELTSIPDSDHLTCPGCITAFEEEKEGYSD